MAQKIFILTIFLFLYFYSEAQREANIWYFGSYAGINFNSGTAEPLTDGRINRWEGVASFSDKYGNLLMYTDGDSVWNASHQHMENGYGLLGDPSSTESAIIVPYPENDSLYYIFTIDEEGGDNGLCYSVVNMNMDNGLGAITLKNKQLITPVVEKLTAVRHHNKQDFWVISHGWETDSFFVYLVTPEGLDTIPQIFEVGARHSDIGLHGNNAVGYLRASPDGTKLASALQVSQLFEIFDFNDETGEISNPISIFQYQGSPYGVEFSPDCSKLYMTSGFYLFQADISSGDPATINNSVVMIDSSDSYHFFGSVQLATDGKIYLAHDHSEYLGVINNPEQYGEDCNFVLDGFYLAGRESRMGLPDFIQTFFLPPDFKYEDYCFGDSTYFYLEDYFDIDSVLWDFGEPTSPNNTSTELTEYHVYAEPGTYTVTLTIWKGGIDYLKDAIIQINPIPEIFLGNDTIICYGDSIILDAQTLHCSYLWNTGSSDSVIYVNEAGLYKVELFENFTGCENEDSLYLQVASLPVFNIGQDTGFCKNDSILLTVEYENADFLWNTGSDNDSIYVNNTGMYILEISDSLTCKNYDTINITEYALPEFSLGHDTSLCVGEYIFLIPEVDGSYLWSDNSTDNYLKLTQAGTYWLQITNSNNCIFRDTIRLSILDSPVAKLGADTVLCEGEYLVLNAPPAFCEYSWSDGTEGDYFETQDPGSYILFATNVCGIASDTIKVDFEYCGEIYIPNIFTPNGDGINETFYISGISDKIWRIFIYNRWGELVYSSEDYKSDWTGDNCTEGTYYYILENPENKTLFSGHVRIYR